MHDQHQPTATDLDMLCMLSAGRREHAPTPTNVTVDWNAGVSILVHNAAEAGVWERYWARHGATGWHGRTNRGDQRSHVERLGQWRGAEIRIVYLAPLPEGVPA